MPVGMSQGLAYRLVFEQDGKLFRPMVVEDIPTHLKKVSRLAWLGEPKSLSLPDSVPALIDGPVGKTLLQVLTNRVEATSIDLRHIAEDSRPCRVWHVELRGTVRKFTNEAGEDQPRQYAQIKKAVRLVVARRRPETLRRCSVVISDV
jgi:hypothetical protein